MMLAYVHFMTFGEWLKAKRAELRFSGGDLERRSGVSRQYISNLERGTVQEKSRNPIQPSVEIVEKLAKALDADIDEARLAAGYAPRNGIPAEIKAIGFDNLDHDDLREIADFIAFRKAQKEKK
jgi:transcriptional regulator with XRE-family HTH domain